MLRFQKQSSLQTAPAVIPPMNSVCFRFYAIIRINFLKSIRIKIFFRKNNYLPIFQNIFSFLTQIIFFLKSIRKNLRNCPNRLFPNVILVKIFNVLQHFIMLRCPKNPNTYVFFIFITYKKIHFF